MTSSKVRSIAGLGTILALLLVGCNTTYEMEVDAISNPSITDAESYIIIPRDPETDTNDLRYKETVDYIKTALSGKGPVSYTHLTLPTNREV